MGVIRRHIKNHKSIYSIVILSFLLGLLFIMTYRVVKLSDDEFHYIPLYNKPATTFQKILNLLPGNLHFTWFFSLNYSMYSFCSSKELEEFYWGKGLKKKRQPYPYELKKYFRKIGWFNLVLLLISGIFAYLIGRELGMGDFYAALGAAFITLNFRLLYYIQGLWPEIIHYLFLLSGAYCFIKYCKKRKIVFLILSSFLFAYAAFAKGVVGYYYYILLAILILMHRKIIFNKKFIVTMLAFMLPYLGCINIQKLANYKKYGVFSLSTNMWVNIEASVIPEKKIMEDGYSHVYSRYFLTGEDPVIREELSRRRVLKYLKETPVFKILKHQVTNYLRLLNINSLYRDVPKNRWIGPTQILYYLGIFSVFISWFLFVFGIAGAVMTFRHGWENFILAAYLAYYLSALFVVGFNIRFFVQAIPFLAIFTALLLEKIFSRRAT